MHAPMSFFETTPLGRIMNRFSKDIDTIDNTLGDALRMFMATLSNIIGAIILISIVLPWFLIAVFAILAIYYYYAVFYRSSARELKVCPKYIHMSCNKAELNCVASGCPFTIISVLAFFRIPLWFGDYPCIR